MKSLVVNYFTSPAEVKKDVARLLVRILDFSEQELIKSGLMQSGLVKSGLMQSGQSVASVQEGAVQVAAQFVQFLERESVPRSDSTAQVPTLVPPSAPSSGALRSATSSTRSSFSGPTSTPIDGASSTIGQSTTSTIPSNAPLSSAYRPQQQRKQYDNLLRIYSSLIAIIRSRIPDWENP